MKGLIQVLIAFAVFTSTVFGIAILAANAASPAFDCVKAGTSVEKLICKDEELAALDRKLAEVYARAYKKAIEENSPFLEADQLNWIKTRNDCSGNQKEKECIKTSYARRIEELHSKYKLPPSE